MTDGQKAAKMRAAFNTLAKENPGTDIALTAMEGAELPALALVQLYDALQSKGGAL